MRLYYHRCATEADSRVELEDRNRLNWIARIAWFAGAWGARRPQILHEGASSGLMISHEPHFRNFQLFNSIESEVDGDSFRKYLPVEQSPKLRYIISMKTICISIRTSWMSRGQNLEPASDPGNRRVFDLNVRRSKTGI